MDAIVIGSGFGGALAAHALITAGWRVRLIERGDWVPRGPANWAADQVGELTRHYCHDTPYRLTGDRTGSVGAFHCVGGPSVFYGGVSLRFRAEDFEQDPEIAGGSGARWPFAYAELEPYYAEAERLLGVAGETDVDPTEPGRSGPFPQRPAPLAPISCAVEAAARSLGLRPFRLPLALNHTASPGRATCIGCGTCDGFACALGAKNDLATAIIRPLLLRGLELVTGTVVTRMQCENGRVTGLEAIDTRTRRRSVHRAPEVLLAAGAVASPHLLLASGVQRRNPGGHVLGRYLMRHWNEIVFGVFPRPVNPGDHFHKQLGLHDFYFGDPDGRGPRGKLGGIQQLATPPAGLVRAHLPGLVGDACAPWVGHLTGLLAMAEDQPQSENRVLLDGGATDRYGMPRLAIRHRYSDRDRLAGATLIGRAREVLRAAGAWAFYRHRIGTFSHAVGTVRMGDDPRTSVVDADCRFRGIDNLHVVDASVMPTSAGVNPSLTIAALALRAATRLASAGHPLAGGRRHAAIPVQ